MDYDIGECEDEDIKPHGPDNIYNITWSAPITMIRFISSQNIIHIVAKTAGVTMSITTLVRCRQPFSCCWLTLKIHQLVPHPRKLVLSGL